VKNVGIVSMGNMGLTIATSMINSGHKVHWTSEGRSEQTIANARAMSQAIEHNTLSELFDISDVVFCIGKLGASNDTIAAAAKYGFKGVYVDGNNLHGEASEKEIQKQAEDANLNYVEALFRGYALGYDQGGGEDKRDVYISGEWRQIKLIESLFTDGIWKIHLVSESAKALNRTKFKRLF
jgi:3-hydroxyisobutyrate dehydrogenase-like beta-hydroxyacid dehydrogenase